VNFNQRAQNRRTHRDLMRKVRASELAQHTCENCGEKGGHWMTTRGLSLAGLLAGKDDSEGCWMCPSLFVPVTNSTTQEPSHDL
jgi:hypothetical protein